MIYVHFGLSNVNKQMKINVINEKKTFILTSVTDPWLIDPESDSDPAIFLIDLQDTNKN